ncbi:MAG: YhcH/YjgK/YiaL family protein [Victivallaceae bacterium]|nr:YhcH/YjgK/YiaL family protein [Victivallaceae bacterium]
MILDSCKNWADYAYGKKEVWTAAFEFVASLKPDCENGRYEIMGDESFALVQSYDTREIAQGKLEAHRKFIDIQTLLSGSERMFYGVPGILELSDEYNPDNDAAFYKYDAGKTLEYVLTPGVFTIFFPEEGHMPGISLKSGTVPVKKVVIKIAAGLLK